MDLLTRLEIAPLQEKIDYRSRLMMLGSCFAENIGNRLKYYRFQTDVNPFGIVYNPSSVANVLNRLLENRLFCAEELLENNGKWVSLFHHGDFSATTPADCLARINNRMKESAAALRQADWLMITFGTSWVYWHKQQQFVVSNCHKFSSGDFERRRLSVEEIVREYTVLVARLREVNPGLKIVFTVSPIRHWKDGAHGNQLSKAVLLLAIEELVNSGADMYYFPSYEIVMDELRDYRFYAKDMLHISDAGIDYIWERFRTAYLSSRIEATMKRVEKINKALAHRAEDTQSRTHKEFLENVMQNIEQLKKEEPNLDFSLFDVSAF